MATFGKTDTNDQGLATTRVLLVDDQQITAKMLDRMIRDEFEMHYCGDPRQAEASAEKLAPHVIILDLVMPEVDGLELLRRFRARPDTAETPIIMLSTEENAGIKAESFTLGANDYLIKLPEEMEMMARLRYHIRAEKSRLERNQAFADLKLAAQVFENASESIVITDADATILDVNDAFTGMSGFTREEALGKTPRINKSDRHEPAFYEAMWKALLEKGRWTGEIWDRRKNGEVYPKWLNINSVKNQKGETTHYIGISSDITNLKRSEERLEKLAYFDALTGLPNRFLFLDRLNQEIQAARRHQKKVALFFIDLDRFKHINDTLGHAAGDQLLVEIAKRVKGCLRRTDTLARLGGDEFTIILTDVEQEEGIGGVAAHVIHEVKKPVRLGENETFVGASIGISLFPDDGQTIEVLTKNADLAMYKAKEASGDTYQFFNEEMTIHSERRMSLETDLRHALENDEFTLHYQPKNDSKTGKLIGVEALVRWNHPRHGLVSPADFIPIAEETGLITTLGEWVLETACRQVLQWRQRGAPELRVAVNISGRQFQDKALLQRIQQILDEVGLPTDGLELEITESVIMDDVEKAVDILNQLRRMGIKISIDDFGTGYSSLAYLKKFPLHSLKIDQSFVRDLEEDSDDAAIVSSIISMAQGLSLGVVAEGVETQGQLDFIKNRACQQVQGYFFSKPVSAEAFELLLDEDAQQRDR